MFSAELFEIPKLYDRAERGPHDPRACSRANALFRAAVVDADDHARRLLRHRRSKAGRSEPGSLRAPRATTRIPWAGRIRPRPTFGQFDPPNPGPCYRTVPSAGSGLVGWHRLCASNVAVELEAAYGAGAGIWIESVSQSSGPDTVPRHWEVRRQWRQHDDGRPRCAWLHGHLRHRGQLHALAMGLPDGSQHLCRAVGRSLSESAICRHVQGLHRRRLRRASSPPQPARAASKPGRGSTGACAGARTHDRRPDDAGPGAARIRESPAHAKHYERNWQ